MTTTELIDKAMKHAQGAEALLSRRESTEVSFENDRLKSASSAQTTRVEVRVIVDGKVGESETTDLADADGVVGRALEAAAFGSPAHFEFAGPGEAPDVALFDADVPALSQQDMVAIGAEMMGIVKDDNSEVLVHAGVSSDAGSREVATSAGAVHTTESTSLGVYVYGQWIRGTDILMAGDGTSWRRRTIDHKQVAHRAVEWLRLAENIAPIRSGELPVIFTPEGLNVLELALVLGINGKNVFLGSSPLAKRLGETIADERLTVVDDPLIDYAPGSGRVDDEGVPRRVTPVVESGVLRNFLYDLDAAGRSRTTSTGNGRGCWPTNLVIKPGDTSYEQMIAETKEGLLVHSMLGLGQGNAISGAFSVNVQLGYKIEDGKVVGRVKDVMLAGNVYDALKSIAAIGDQPRWVHGLYGSASLAPPIKIARLSVTAK